FNLCELTSRYMSCMLVRAYRTYTVQSMQHPTQIPMDRWEVFLRTLAERVSSASEKNPTPRCWKPSTLSNEIAAITKANQTVLRTTFPPAHAVIDQLERIGWIHPIKTQSPDGAGSVEFLLLDMEAGKGDPIYP